MWRVSSLPSQNQFASLNVKQHISKQLSLWQNKKSSAASTHTRSRSTPPTNKFKFMRHGRVVLRRMHSDHQIDLPKQIVWTFTRYFVLYPFCVESRKSNTIVAVEPMINASFCRFFLCWIYEPAWSSYEVEHISYEKRSFSVICRLWQRFYLDSDFDCSSVNLILVLH